MGSPPATEKTLQFDPNHLTINESIQQPSCDPSSEDVDQSEFSTNSPDSRQEDNEADTEDDIETQSKFTRHKSSFRVTKKRLNKEEESRRESLPDTNIGNNLLVTNLEENIHNK